MVHFRAPATTRAVLAALLLMIPCSTLAFLVSESTGSRRLTAKKPLVVSFASKESSASISASAEEERASRRKELFNLLGSTPSNAPTSPDFTNYILGAIQRLEQVCPTPDQDVLGKLGGTWELLWTAQDRSSEEYNTLGPLFTWINPIEDQSYSNNPDGSSGRLNPVLPRAVQDQLERMGLIRIDQELANVKSTQSIDLQKRRVRNIVTFAVPGFPDASNTRRASLTVDIDITPHASNARRVNVKFQACRLIISKSPIDINFPLGLLGPTGWLVTDYIDDDIRITRGHKGSVFVLRRPRKSAEV
ncbi:PAP_fibrillin [Seminavis robusta]|uniref:PAP_fibrillin n=1 Tax=Seminavis robusta TaxID=568900 RepID=A0A9N8EUW0_9STRA|nr:PAP_fibrillin [Seminavis robusta]|eukprot:Sro1948_g307240.1 PAP_fibrillin (304) ;mRNA; f:17170-18228